MPARPRPTPGPPSGTPGSGPGPWAPAGLPASPGPSRGWVSPLQLFLSWMALPHALRPRPFGTEHTQPQTGTPSHPVPTSTPRKLGWPPRCVLPRRPAPVPTPSCEVCPSCADKPSPESPSPSPRSWLHRSPAPVPVLAWTLHGKATEYLLVTTSRAFDTALDVTALLTTHAVPEPWTPSPELPPCPSSVLQSCAPCSREGSTAQSPALCSSPRNQSTLYSSVPSGLFTVL
ncbi:uncharacterized protein LOC133081607 [Eubalaena glacialis]|uniref:uncharacterized protein LOC133081607 n=1 Tax=Eubalaena glacialis TaxID=27606 RepID=UPI002A5A9A31|nr:uncharacterized protein LOC133081607 [Eubalaena glacialis]